MPASLAKTCRQIGRVVPGLIVPYFYYSKSRQAKVFFSEEKKQKTFMSLSRIYPEARAQDVKVFWFFFSKKNRLP
jgi:hypothetical protein